MGSQKAIWDDLYKKRLTWRKEAITLPKLLKGKSVLELGVGTGKTLKSILRQDPKSVTAIDFSEEAIKKAKELIKSDKAHFIKTDFFDFQSAEKFDAIVCYYFLNNLQEREREKAAEIIKNLLNPNGIIFFEDFAIGDFREKQKRKDGLICHFFTKAEIQSLFRSFSSIKLSEKTSQPIKLRPELERKIISAVISN